MFGASGVGGLVSNAQANQARRVELILKQLDSLPTLSPVAVRLLELTTAEDSDARRCCRLFASGPGLCIVGCLCVIVV